MFFFCRTGIFLLPPNYFSCFEALWNSVGKPVPAVTKHSGNMEAHERKGDALFPPEITELRAQAGTRESRVQVQMLLLLCVSGFVSPSSGLLLLDVGMHALALFVSVDGGPGPW